MKDQRVRSRSFRVWKNGQIVSARFEGSEYFHRPALHERLSKDRIFAVDTESLSVGGKLSTVLIPLRFHDWGELLETPAGMGMLETFLHAVVDKYGEEYKKEYQVEQRSREERKKRLGAGSGRDGRRKVVKPVLAVFFNLPYDFGRLSADRRDILKAVSTGPDSYKVAISDRLQLEVVRMHFGSGSSFEWFVRRDAHTEDKEIVRIIGLDLAAYWKTSLAEAAQSVGVIEKLDIDPSLYSKPREAFTEEEWATFKRYALGDTESTLALYHATVDLLVQLDARVIRRTGIIPPSAPGASAKIVFAQAFDLVNAAHRVEKPGCHPGIASWQRYSSEADQMGLDAYFGGRSFNIVRGVLKRMAVFDLKSAYPYALSLLPDPVSVRVRPVLSTRERVAGRDAKGNPVSFSAPAWHEAREAHRWDQQSPVVTDGSFDLDYWRGKFGVLYIDGESLDDLYPPFRVHSARKSDSGRLRYVAGHFENRAVTIPEICVGVASGRLRVDRIRKGVVMEGDPRESFIRAGILDFFQIKEDATKPKPLRDMAKLLAVSLYGKLVEIHTTDLGVGSVFPMARFAKTRAVREGISRIHVQKGPPLADVDIYWGDSKAQVASARSYYERCQRSLGEGEDRGTLAVVDYVTALRRAGVVLERKLDGSYDETPIAISDYVGQAHRCGFYFFPLLAANVTGIVSAMLGVMAREIGALQGDTDAVQCVVPVGRKPELPDRYFEIMRDAGYPSPRLVDGKYVDAIPGGEKLGIWELETPVPSIESVLVRPKVYSHVFDQGMKQARHGFARFGATPGDLVGAYADQLSRVLREVQGGRFLEARSAQRALERFEKALGSEDLAVSDDASMEARQQAFHEALRTLVTTGSVSYQGRATPRKLKESLVTGKEIGEFNSRVFESMLTEDPNTFRDAEGRTRWKRAVASSQKAMGVPVRPVTQKRRTA
jgi:hypothetical protein